LSSPPALEVATGGLAGSARAGFSGWRVVAILSLAQACGIGLLQIYSPFVQPLMLEFDLTATVVGSGMSIFILMLTGAGPLLGRFVDRGYARLLMPAGVLVMLGGALLMANAEVPWQLAAGMAVASLGIALFGPIPANVTVTHWFLLRRGTALAIVAAGGAVAGFGLPPLAAWLIEQQGWRTALTLIASAAAIIAFPALLAGLVARPDRIGQTRDGLPAEPDQTGLAEPTPDGLAQWLASRDFWLLAVGMALVFAVPVGIGLYLVPFLVEQGESAPRAALALSVAAVAAFVGTMGTGVLADRWPPKTVMLGLLTVFALSYVALATWPGMTTALICAVGIGFAAGGVGPLAPLFAGLRFGAPVIGRVMGVQGLIGLPLLAAGAPLVGRVRETTGSYDAAFFGAAGVLALAGLLLWLFRLEPPPPRTERTHAGG
jgi:predicted MFS family arabinose efflux permease